MTTYASKTSVSASKSVIEIERILSRYGASEFMMGRSDEKRVAFVAFQIGKIPVKITLPIPDKADYQFSDAGRERTKDATEKAWDQAYRQRWRAATLVIKAKLEAVESGISTIEREFLGNIILPGGTTIADHFLPEIENMKLGITPMLSLPEPQKEIKQ